MTISKKTSAAPFLGEFGAHSVDGGGVILSSRIPPMTLRMVLQSDR